MPRHALVITVDHLATSLIGAYGRFDVQTPTLDQLAARSFVFHSAFGQVLNESKEGDLTRQLADGFQSASVNFQSLIPPRNPPPREWTHEATDTIRQTLASPQSELLWIPFEGIADPWIPTHAGWEAEVAQRLRTTWEELLADEPGLTPQQAVAELGAEGHFSRCRRPLTPSVDADQLSLALYQSCVERLDERLGRLIREFQRHAHNNSLLIVAGLSGENLPHAWPVTRLVQLTTEAVRVPLFVQPGTGCPVGTAVLELVSVEDLWPTALAWVDEDRTPQPGDLLSVAHKVHPGRAFIRCQSPDGETLVRTPTAQLVARGSRDSDASQSIAWLTLKPEDEWDLLNVAGQNPELVDELHRLAGI